MDDDPISLAALEHDLERRYGSDYRIVAIASPAAALDELAQLRADGSEVALVIADQWMPGLGGVELLTRSQDLHPTAKRALLVDGINQSALEPLQQATALGRIDTHLHKPWAPADDLLHPAITELLAEWTRSQRPRAELVRIVGERWHARTHELRDLLGRNSIGSGLYEAGTSAADAVLLELRVAQDRLPVVHIRGGPTLIQPTNVELAAALGVKTSATPEPCDVAIIGAGPAGLSAAVYAASEGLRTVVVEREAMGGQATTSSMIRNYLGFPRGISGTELASRAYSQAWHFGAEFVFAQEAIQVRSEERGHAIPLSGGSELRAEAVVLATGVSYRRLGAPGIDHLIGAGVFYGGATNEASAMTGQDVFVIGGANSAGQAAIHLARFAERVTLIVRGGSFEGTMSAYLREQVARTHNIDVRLNSQVVEGQGERRLEGLLLENRRTGQVDRVPAAALFILIGAEPRTEWLGPSFQRDRRGFVLTGPDLRTDGPNAWRLPRGPEYLETSVSGIFAVGDVRYGSVKRVASAVGEGGRVVSLVHQHLARMRVADHTARNTTEGAVGSA